MCSIYKFEQDWWGIEKQKKKVCSKEGNQRDCVGIYKFAEAWLHVGFSSIILYAHALCIPLTKKPQNISTYYGLNLIA